MIDDPPRFPGGPFVGAPPPLPRPRPVLPTAERWAAPYRDLEGVELTMRARAAAEFPEAVGLWLAGLALFHEAFLGAPGWADLGADEPPGVDAALQLRCDLLVVAGTASKATLDQILGGYYWQTFGSVRALLESWRAAAFVRRAGEAALPWFEPPEEPPVGPDGRVRRGRSRAVPPGVIAEAFRGAPPGEVEVLDLVNAGIAHLHGGAHPSAEGALQLWAGGHPHRVFGPTFARPLGAFCLRWGLLAHLVLLMEVHLLLPQPEGWWAAYDGFGRALERWQAAYDAEFPDEVPDPDDA